MIPLLIVVGVFCLVCGLFYYAHLQAKKRTQALKRVAGSLDLDFSAEKRKPSELGLGHMHLFTRGRAKKAYNIMSGQFADAECRLFDYRYTTGSGKNSSTHVQTVVAFRIPNAGLPQFICKPEHFFHKFADIFGFKDINFDEYANFSKKYRLNGEDEARIRQIFTADAIHLLESKDEKPWNVDGAGDWLVIHRSGKKVDPEACPDFLLDCTTLLNAMTLP